MKNMLQNLPITAEGSYQPGGSSDAFNTFMQALEAMNSGNITGTPGGKANGGLISGIALLGNDDD